MKLKKLASLIILPIILGVAILAPTQQVFADDICNNDKIPEDIRLASGCTVGNKTVAGLPEVITNILNGIIAVAGIVAVIFVIVGGINYMTSGGDSAKVQKAKNTILYALFGMIICVLSFAIVNFVIIKIIG